MARTRLLAGLVLALAATGLSACGGSEPSRPGEAAAPAGPTAAPGSHGEGPHTRVELVSEARSLKPGTVAFVGLRFTLDPHWHLYWRNPGDSGTPPAVRWTLPPGFEAGPIEWPVPTRVLAGPLAAFVHEGEVLLPVRLRVPEYARGEVLLVAAVEWLACEEECLPGEAVLGLRLPVSASDPAPDPRTGPWFEAAAASRPRPVAAGSARADAVPGAVALRLSGDGPWRAVGAKATWFPDGGDAFAHAANPRIAVEGSSATVSLPLSRPGRPAPGHVRGVLSLEAAGARTDWAVDLRVEGGAAERTAGPAVPEAAPPEVPADPPLQTLLPPEGDEVGSIWAAVLLAFLGGLLLNVMPCVLPVLSLKVLGFVQQAGDDRPRVRRHGWTFAAGVMASFWALVGGLIALRSAGRGLGWGFQFQEPGFTGALCLVMFAVGLNLLGVFELGGRLAGLAGAADARTRHRGYAGSFLSGVLATVVATPCTAPFMGPAVGYALARPAGESFAVFTALGAGMAAPYVVLSTWPGWLRRLPPPGPWMETFKHAMAWPMFAVVVGVAHVFERHTGPQGHTALLAALLALGVAAWLYGRFGSHATGAGARWVAGRGLGAGFLALSVLTVAWAAGRTPPQADDPPEGWIAWRPGVVEELRAQGRPVFLDFTADWCLTCKANDVAVLSTSHVREAAQRLGVAMVQADWTRKNPEIAAALEALGRQSVPTYVMYPADRTRPPVLLPTTITPGMVVEAFQHAVGAPPASPPGP